MKLEILGESLDFPEESVRYLEVRKAFIQLADKQQSSFVEHFDSKYNSLDDLVESGFEEGISFIAPAIELTLRHLTQYEIYDFDEKVIAKSLFQECKSYEVAVERLHESYQKIVLSEAELDEYRTRRREGRGQIIGGGFGVGGAIKGMVMAGAANAAIGAVHMAFNGVGKVFSSIGSSIEKNNVLNSEKENHTLAKAIWQMIYNAHLLLIRNLNEAKGVEVIKPLYTEERASKAQAILKNLQKFPPTDKEVLKRKYIEIVQLCPFSKDLFKSVLRDFGDSNQGLVAFAGMIGIDIFPHKKELIKQSFLGVDFNNQSNVRSGLDKVVKEARYLGINPEDIGTFGMAQMSIRKLHVAIDALEKIGNDFPELLESAKEALSAQEIKLEAENKQREQERQIQEQKSQKAAKMVGNAFNAALRCVFYFFVFVTPYIFAWFTLRNGTKREKIVAFSWMITLLLMFSMPEDDFASVLFVGFVWILAASWYWDPEQIAEREKNSNETVTERRSSEEFKSGTPVLESSNEFPEESDDDEIES